jgi:glycosyltransferase involved in cell wall biosynthesis
MIPSPSSQPVIVIGVTNPQTCLVMRGRLRAFRLAGFRVVLVASPGPLLDRIAASEGVQAVAIPMQREIALASDLVSLWQLWRLLGQLRPEIVEFSTPKAGLLGMLAARMRGIRSRVYLLRGLKLETATGFKRRLLLAAERLTCRSAHVVIANSPSLRDKALALRLMPAARLVLLGGGSSRGVDVVQFCPGPSSARQQLGIAPDAPVVGFVGRLTRDKGVPELVDAFEKVLRRYSQTRLLLVGWFDAAEDALPKALRRRIENDPRMVVTGMVDAPRDYYRAMDLMVLPSWREGFPNAVLEAAATGIPVVTTLATGARDSVLPEVTGLLVPPGNAEAVAEAVLTLLDNPERRQRMGQAARNWVLEGFLDAQVLTLTVKFYQGLIANHCAPAVDGVPALRL